MKHEKTKLMAFVDYDPAQHQGKCECGYTTFRNADLGAVLGELKAHREKAAAEVRP